MPDEADPKQGKDCGHRTLSPAPTPASAAHRPQHAPPRHEKRGGPRHPPHRRAAVLPANRPEPR
ncbi:MAG: hypothetical protein CW348_01285 [Thermobifida sp.]|nr:hypothetical protein [Thermobifida sp.]